MKKLDYKQLNESIYTYTLANGLAVYFYQNKKVNNFYLSLTTKFGGKDVEFKYEDEKEYHKIPDGVAHFLEHITFHLDGKEADELFKPYGAHINATTSFDKTSYLVSGANGFKECLDNLLYYVYTPYYTEETVANEKGIIKEESKRSKDNVNRVFYLSICKALFSKSHFRNSIVGELDDIDSITLEDIRYAYDYFYHPSNMFLVVSGNFDIDEAVEVINKRMDSFNFGTHKKVEVLVPSEPKEVNESYKELEENVLNSKVAYCIKVPVSAFDKLGLKEYECQIYIGLILNSVFGSTSDFYLESLENDLVVNSSGAYIDKQDNYYLIEITNSPKNDRFEDYINLIEKYIKDIHVDEKKIARKIKVYKSSYILSFDDNEDVAEEIISNIIDDDEIILDYMDVLDRFTMEIAEKIIDIIDFSNKSIVILKKKGDN